MRLSAKRQRIDKGESEETLARHACLRNPSILARVFGFLSPSDVGWSCSRVGRAWRDAADIHLAEQRRLDLSLGCEIFPIAVDRIDTETGLHVDLPFVPGRAASLISSLPCLNLFGHSRRVSPVYTTRSIERRDVESEEYCHAWRRTGAIVGDEVQRSLYRCACMEDPPGGCIYDGDGRLVRITDMDPCELAGDDLEEEPLFECGDACACGPQSGTSVGASVSVACFAGVVQRGLQRQGLRLVHTSGKGWGVTTRCAIPRGSFVCEYVGERISSAETRRRRAIYADFGLCNYIYTLREHYGRDQSASHDGSDGDRDVDVDNDDDPDHGGKIAVDSSDDLVVRFHIDATLYGNVSRYFNHSCSPTLVMHAIRVHTRAPGSVRRMMACPRFAFFARVDIAAGEELTFSYGGGASTKNTNQTERGTANQCVCGSVTCRGVLPADND